MWYYDWNKQPFGPVSKETIAEALKAGKIDAATRVWQEGMTEWKRLDQTQLALLVGLIPPVEAVPISREPSLVAAAVSLQPAAAAAPIAPTSKVSSKGLQQLFTWWVILTAVSLFFSLLTRLLPNETWVTTLTCIFTIPSIASSVLQYILLYKFWKVIQDGLARTTPGKAIGFLFIPFFSLYWIFVAILGLSKDMNAYVDRHCSTNPTASVHKTHPLIALLFILVSLGQSIFLGIIYVQVFNATLASLGDYSQLTHMSANLNIPLLVVSFVHTALLLFLYWEYYQTSQDILSAEDKQP